MNKLTAMALFLIIIMISGCGLPGDPVLDDFYTRNVYPGTAGTYTIGSEEYPYSEGWFDTLTVTDDLTVGGTLTIEDLTVGGTLTIDALTGILRADAGLVSIDPGNGANVTGYATVSEANRSIYVDKEATGAADGTSWADAFTTIQAAVNDMEDVVIHAHIIYVRDGTKKTGTADENTLNHLVDDASSQFVAGDVGKRVFNVTDGTWGVVGSFVDAGDVGIIDTAGANLDLFSTGTETYAMEATPYRETVYLNSLPATNPAKLILGSATIEAEYYWYGDCDAQANAGEILDATADFTNVELGDRVVVYDLNGANGRCQDYEWGTVDDISQVGSDIVRTTLAKTPTANWKYLIVKCEISGSDDGLDSGTARDYIILASGINGAYVKGFFYTWSDDYFARIGNCDDFKLSYYIAQNVDLGFRCDNSRIEAIYNGTFDGGSFVVRAEGAASDCRLNYSASNVNLAYQARTGAMIYTTWFAIDDAATAHRVYHNSIIYSSYGIILNTVTTGYYVNTGGVVAYSRVTNNAAIPESPAGTPNVSSIMSA